MTPSNAYELLGELSRAIDDSLELDSLLQHFLSELRRLFAADGAAALESPTNTPPGQTPIVCLNPDTLPRDPRYAAFWEDWSPQRLETALDAHPHRLPILSAVETGQVLATRLPGFGLLILVRSATAGELSPDLQQGLALVAMTLAQAARSARRMDETRRRLESTQLARSQCVADVGREMRTSLKDILELSELTLHSALEAGRRDSLQLIRTSTARLLDHVDELLDFARIETGQLIIEQIPFNPAVLITDLLDTVVTQAQGQGRAIRPASLDALPTNSQGDPSRIRQILTTLANAALVFSVDDGLRFQVQHLPSEPSASDWIQFSALGLRLPLTELQRLIDPSAATAALYEHSLSDSGLRLATCARLIEHMGGRIWLDTPADSGSLHFTLPLTRLEAGEAPPPPPSASWPGRRALLIDNQAVSRRTLAYWFRHWGFEVREASTGPQALELARAHQGFDVYVFDSTLPELDGFELAARLREEPAIERAVLVMLASIGQRGDAQRCHEAGIDAFLTKPASPRELRELLTQLLRPEDATRERRLLTRHRLVEYRQRLRILLVESGLLHQKLACALFQEWGYETRAVDSGSLAIEQFRSERYDLVFLDLSLPDVDGIEVARAMRRLREAEPGTRRTPIIGMSMQSPDSEHCAGAELDAHIVKPLNPVLLEDVIRRFVRSADEPPI